VVAALWLAAGELARQAQAFRLPRPPDLGAAPEAVVSRLREADALARRQPASADAVGALGMAYHASLLDEQAQAAYAMAEALDAASWRWTYYRGLLAESRGRTDAAVELFTRVTLANPAWALAWYRLGDAQLKRGRPDEARAAFERARSAPTPSVPSNLPGSRTAPVAVYATAALARLSLEAGDVAAARALIDDALRQQPRFGPAERLRRQTDAPGDQPPSRAFVPPADPLLDEIVRMSGRVELLLTHAAIAARAGDRAWREFLVRRAVEIAPRDPDVLLEMATMLRSSGRLEEALDYLRLHQQVSPDDHHGLVEQGQCLIDLGRPVEAEAVLRRALRVPDAAAEYNLGVALERQARWDEAGRHYERAVALDPFHARALNNLALLFARRGDRAGARRLHDRALAASPDSLEIQTNVATSFLLEGRTADALALLRRAIALDPQSADAHNALGVALAQAGRTEEAMAAFREAVRLAPDHADAQANLRRLQTAGPGP
jgi:tetratricopeptide (TPR) repeat protein